MHSILAALALLTMPDDGLTVDSPFAQRGYYITFMRMPTYDLADWKKIVDGIHDDGGNTLLLWVGGAFRSKAYPITWKYNADHENVRKDFVRDLIDHAHTRGVKVLLGFTPFGYDGVNQYPLEHPELKAIGKDGKPVAPFGIGCWGYNLCPSRPESQKFMLEYVREMAFDFYPNADGLLIESSDYAICHCKDCKEKFFEKEFEFVRRISEEVWAKKPKATVIVFPHYFSGAEVPGFGVKAARLPFDPRWSLVFTPHSSNPEPELIKKARSSVWWDDSPALRRPQEIRAGARRARDLGVSGYIPRWRRSRSSPPRPRRGRRGSRANGRCRWAWAGWRRATRLTKNCSCGSTGSPTGSSAVTPTGRSRTSRSCCAWRSSARTPSRRPSRTCWPSRPSSPRSGRGASRRPW